MSEVNLSGRGRPSAWLAERIVSLLEIFYRESGNAVTPWAAWQYARQHGASVPEWVKEYFDHSADEILVLTGHRTGKQVAYHITQALGLGKRSKGARSPLSEYHQFQDKVMTALDVIEELEKGETLTRATSSVAAAWSERGRSIDPKTVERAYRELKNFVQTSLRKTYPFDH